MKPRNGTVVVELNHSGIPDSELQPEAFCEQQLAVLRSLDPKVQEKINVGYPITVIDLGTGTTLASFNRKNVAASEYQLRSLARALIDSIEEYYSNPDNLRKYEEWNRQKGKT